MLGVIVNFLAIMVGGTLGTFMKKGIPENLSKVVIYALGLCMIYIGISGALEGQNTLVAIISMAVGTVIGEALDLDGRITRLAEKIGSKLQRPGTDNRFAEGFVTATMMFCIGAMAVMGSFDAGLNGDNTTLFTKSVIDGISSIAFSSAMGMGVTLAGFVVLIYEGSLALLAQFIAVYISDYMVAEMTCAGSLLILAIGLNMLEMTNLKVMNMLPAVFMPFILCNFM